MLNNNPFPSQYHHQAQHQQEQEQEQEHSNNRNDDAGRRGLTGQGLVELLLAPSPFSRRFETQRPTTRSNNSYYNNNTQTAAAAAVGAFNLHPGALQSGNAAVRTPQHLWAIMNNKQYRQQNRNTNQEDYRGRAQQLLVERLLAPSLQSFAGPLPTNTTTP
jgi:hypothetical protein